MAKKIITIEVAQCKCEKCGFEWIAKTVNPKICPKCKSAGWDEVNKSK